MKLSFYVLYFYRIKSSKAVFDDKASPRVEVDLRIIGISLIAFKRRNAKGMNFEAFSRFNFRGKSLIIDSKCGGRLIMNAHAEAASISECAKANQNDWPIAHIANHNSNLPHFTKMRDVGKCNGVHVKV
jgi:hypothetical protein